MSIKKLLIYCSMSFVMSAAMGFTYYQYKTLPERTNPFANCELHSKQSTGKYRSGIKGTSRQYEIITTYWCPEGFKYSVNYEHWN